MSPYDFQVSPGINDNPYEMRNLNPCEMKQPALVNRFRTLMKKQ